MVSHSILEIVDRHAPVPVPTQAYFLYTFFFLFLIQKELSWQEKTCQIKNQFSLFSFKKENENLLHTTKQQVNHSTDLYYIKKIQNVHPASFLLLLFFMLCLCIQIWFTMHSSFIEPASHLFSQINHNHLCFLFKVALCWMNFCLKMCNQYEQYVISRNLTMLSQNIRMG